MKKYIIIIIISLSLTAVPVKSQIAIGKAATSNGTVSLEFGTENRGLLLPWVTAAADVTGAVDGTIIFDSTDKKIKYRRAGIWSDLTVTANGVVELSLQTYLTEQDGAGVKIGANADIDTAPGILVLTDTDKAMILPKVTSPDLNIINPSPGMMVYDTGSRQLAVFNGTVWTYWRP